MPCVCAYACVCVSQHTMQAKIQYKMEHQTQLKRSSEYTLHSCKIFISCWKKFQTKPWVNPNCKILMQKMHDTSRPRNIYRLETKRHRWVHKLLIMQSIFIKANEFQYWFLMVKIILRSNMWSFKPFASLSRNMQNNCAVHDIINVSTESFSTGNWTWHHLQIISP